MKEIIKETLLHNLWFYVFSAIAIAMLIAAFLCPPLAVIDASVLYATAEIFAFAALGTVIKAIDKGIDARLKHGNTSIQVGNLDADNDMEDNG